MFRAALLLRMLRYGSKVDKALRSDSPGGRKLTVEEATGLLDDGVTILRDLLLKHAGPKAAALLSDG